MYFGNAPPMLGAVGVTTGAVGVLEPAEPKAPRSFSKVSKSPYLASRSLILSVGLVGSLTLGGSFGISTGVVVGTTTGGIIGFSGVGFVLRHSLMPAQTLWVDDPNNANFDPVTGNYKATTNEDTPVSGQVKAKDVDGDPLTFFILYGNDEALFTVGPTTGRFTVAPLIPGGLSLDFERKSRYLIVVQASDPGGLSCSVEVSMCTIMSGTLLLVWAFRVLRVDHARPQHVPPPRPLDSCFTSFMA